MSCALTNKQKVVHLTTVHNPYDTRIYHKECRSLQEAGFDVSLIVPVSDDGIITDEQNVAIIPVKKYNSRLKRMIMSTFQVYRKAKQIDADYYHFHDPELLIVGWLLKNNNNHVIYDIHEDYYTSIMQKEYIAKPLRRFMGQVYNVMERFFSKKMDLCLAEKYYQEKYPRGKCILNYPKLNKKLIEHYNENKSKGNALIYTGNVSLDRGASIHSKIPLIDEEVEIHFIGKCPGQIAEVMYTNSKGNSDRLIIEGINRFVEREEIDAKYISKNWLAGLAIFPPTDHYMKKELTKFFEYMSVGIPIICSDFPVWRRFIEKYQCGITVDPSNPEAIRNAIDYIKKNPLEASRMGNNGKEAVMKELNWDLEEMKLVEWYKELMVKHEFKMQV